MGYTQKLGLLAQSVFQDSSLNVGIGAAPSGTYKFEVTGTAKVSSTLLLGGALSGTSATFSSDLTSLTIKSTYSGTTNWNSFGNQLFIGPNGANNSYFSDNMYYNGAWLFANAGAGAQIYFGATAAGSIDFRTAPTGAAGGTPTITNRMTILQGGNVGIGTSSPSEKLHLYNNTAGTPTTLIIENNVNNQNSQINFKSVYGGSTAKSFLIGSNISVAAGSWEIYDATAATARLVITSGGNVHINQTSGATNIKLKIRVSDQSSSNYAFAIDNSVTDLILVRNDGALLLPQQYSWDITGGTTRTMQIRSDGLVGYITSLRASKANITSIETSNWLNQLNPVNFNYRKRDEDNNYTNDLHSELEYGLIAEEVEAINSDMVFYDIKEDGSKELRGVSYEKLIIPILRLVQELSKQNQDLKSRLDKAGL